MLSFYKDVEELFSGDESGEDRVNYQLLLAAQDCLNTIVLQFHKLDPVANGTGNEYDEESFEERLKFLEYGSYMEVFIYQTKKYYSLITEFAKRIDSREVLELIDEQKSIIINNVESYIQDNETLAERIINGQTYVSPVDFIVEGKVKTRTDEIFVYPEEISPLNASWRIAIQDYKKYMAG